METNRLLCGAYAYTVRLAAEFAAKKMLPVAFAGRNRNAIAGPSKPRRLSMHAVCSPHPCPLTSPGYFEIDISRARR